MSDIITISQNSRKYPKLLREIPRPPQKLYARGNISLLNSNCFAIVGTRSYSVYGELNTRTFTKGLLSYGLTIVSGLAFGIDAEAHQATLDNGGQTIAVLGSGIDDVRPAGNEGIAHEILAKKGLILSEYAPGMPAQAHHYPARNRIISGLSVGTLVIEAPTKSGALITAKRAFEQNREVFAIPGALHQETMRGNNNLIASEIARLVRNPEDIIAYLREQPELLLKPTLKKNKIPQLETKAQQQVFDLLRTCKNTVFHPDDVLKKTNLSVIEVSVAISYLELKGYVERVGLGQFTYRT